MSQVPPGTPHPATSTAYKPPAIFRSTSQASLSSSSISFISTISSSPTRQPSNSSATSISCPPPSSNSNHPCDCDFERQRHQRQNQEIIRQCTLKAIQIRQSETKLSQLETENLDLRTALRHAQRKISAKTDLGTPIDLSSPLSSSDMYTSPENLDMHVRRKRSNGEPLYENYPTKRSKSMARTDSDIDDNAARENYVRSHAKDQKDSPSNGYSQTKSQRMHSLSSPHALSKLSLAAKLNHIQAIYEREHETLCSMMANHNSTTLLYKDLICLLEKESFRPDQNSCRSHDHWSMDTPLSHPPMHYHHQHLLNTSALPKTSSTETQRSSPMPWIDHGSDYLTSPVSPLCTSPSKFVTESEKFFGGRTGDPWAPALPRSPTIRPVKHTGQSSRMCSQILSPATATRRIHRNLETESTTATCLDMTDQIQSSSEQALRISIRNSSKINKLFPINEQGDGSDGGSQRPVRASSPPSPPLQQNLLDPVSPRLSPQQDQHSSVVRNLKRGHANRSPYSPRNRMGSPYKQSLIPLSVRDNPSVAESKKSGMNVQPNAKLLSRSLLEKYKKPTAAASSSSDVASGIDRDDNFSGKNQLRGETHNSIVVGDADEGMHTDIQSGGTISSYNDINTNSSKENNILVSGIATKSNHRKRQASVRTPTTIATTSRRADDSNTVKSHFANTSEYLKYLTPQQLLSRMSESLLGTPKPPELPRSIVQNAILATKQIIPQERLPSAVSRSSTTSALGTQSGLRYVLSAKHSRLCREGEMGDENQASSGVNLVPPPALRPNSGLQNTSPAQRQYFRKKREVVVEIPLRRNSSFFSSTKGQNVGTLHQHQRPSQRKPRVQDDAADEAHAMEDGGPSVGDKGSVNQGSFVEQSSKNLKERTARIPITYKLPSLNSKLHPGDPGTYSLNTPIRPLPASDANSCVNFKRNIKYSKPPSTTSLPSKRSRPSTA